MLRIFKVSIVFIMMVHLCQAQLSREARKDSLKNLLSNNPTDTSTIKVLHDLSLFYVIQKPDTAISLMDQAIQLSKKLNKEDRIPILLYDKGRVVYQVKREQQAGMRIYRQALAISKGKSRVKLFNVISGHHKSKGNYDSALYYNGLAREHCIVLGDEQLLASSYQHLSSIQWNLGNSEEVISNQLKAVTIYERIKNDKLLANALGNLANYYSGTAQYSEAIQILQKALNLDIRREHKQGQAFIYSQLANIYRENSLEDKAFENIHKAVNIREELGDLRGLATNSNFIGGLHLDKGNTQEAIKWFNKAIDYNSQDKKIIIFLKSYNFLGKAFFSSKSYDSAYHFFNQVYTLSKEKGNVPYQINGLIGLSRIDTAQNDWSAAINNTRTALQLAENGGYIKNILNANKILHNSYYELGNYKEAYKHLLLYKQSSDSLFNEEKSQEFGKVEAKYAYDLKAQKLQTENEIRESELQAKIFKERYLAVTGGTVLLVFLGFMVYLYNLKKKSNQVLIAKNKLIQQQSKELALSTQKEKELMSLQIESKDRELALYAMQSIEKNNVLMRLDKTFSNSEFEQLDMKEVKQLININVNNEESWNNFINQFEEVYPNFFSRIKSDYEGLTLNQLKICAYIKVGMDNRDIANVTNTELASVKKNINRMKKKLNLSAEDSIRDFLIKYGENRKALEY